MNTVAKANRRASGRAQGGYTSRVASLNGSLRLEGANDARLQNLVIEGNSQSTENGILHMESTTLRLGGTNLFDISQPKYSGNATVVEKTSNSITVEGKGSWVSANFTIPNWRALIGRKVVITGAVSKSADTINAGLYVRWFNGSLGVGSSSATIGVYGEKVKGDVSASGTVEAIDLEKYPNARLCVAVYSNTNKTDADGTERTTYSNIMVSTDGAPYEPYITPQEVEIPSQVSLKDGTALPIRLGRVGGKADVIEVLGTHSKVWYYEAFPEPSSDLELDSQATYDKPIKHDITNTDLGKALLELNTGDEKMCLDVYSSISPSKLDATFYSSQNPETATLKINYKCNGSDIRQVKVHSVRRGSGFEANSEHIQGYVPEAEVIRGVATDDTEITFNYKRSTK